MEMYDASEMSWEDAFRWQSLSIQSIGNMRTQAQRAQKGCATKASRKNKQLNQATCGCMAPPMVKSKSGIDTLEHPKNSWFNMTPFI